MATQWEEVAIAECKAAKARAPANTQPVELRVIAVIRSSPLHVEITLKGGQAPPLARGNNDGA